MNKPAPIYADDFSYEWYVEWDFDNQRDHYEEWWINVEVHEPYLALRPVATIETPEGKAEKLSANDLRKLAAMFERAAGAMDRHETAIQKSMSEAVKRICAEIRAGKVGR